MSILELRAGPGLVAADDEGAGNSSFAAPCDDVG